MGLDDLEKELLHHITDLARRYAISGTKVLKNGNFQIAFEEKEKLEVKGSEEKTEEKEDSKNPSSAPLPVELEVVVNCVLFLLGEPETPSQRRYFEEIERILALPEISQVELAKARNALIDSTTTLEEWNQLMLALWGDNSFIVPPKRFSKTAITWDVSRKRKQENLWKIEK